MHRVFAALIAVLLMALPLSAQDDPRAATGGAQTLEDIMARQAAQAMDDSFRSDNLGQGNALPPVEGPLGTRGAASDPDLWRALRYNKADITTQSRHPSGTVLVQDSGMDWLDFRSGPVRTYGGYLLLGMLALLTVFYVLRGKIMIDGELSGKTIQRFKFIERFAHWLLGGSFIVLAITGLVLLFGRVAVIPWLGHDAYAVLASGGKWVHNNISWAFMVGLIMVTVFWIAHNIPNRHDLKWIAVAGGLFTKGVHPPARKFNAGQKLIFWSVIVLGFSISASGLSLLFPFELPMFAKTFALLNDLGLPQLVGLDLPSTLNPIQEMQLAQLWHAIVAFVFIAIILGHIYIGSVGMQGAYDAMGSGDVDEQWAREHHSLWYEEAIAKRDAEQENTQ